MSIKMVFPLISVLLVSTAFSYEHKTAEKLFEDAQCMSCHNELDFSPRKGKVDSFAKLQKSVNACRFAHNVHWFDDESTEVAKYLNRKYYKFKEPQED